MVADPQRRREDAAARQRRSELGAIHAAKKGLALTEECYRDLVERVTGKRSAKDLDGRERSRVIEEFRRLGWQRARSQTPTRVAGAPLPPPPTAGEGRGGGAPAHKAAREKGSKQLRKITALWLSLHHLAEVDDPSETALEHFATTLTKKDRMVWTDAADLVWVTEALLDWCRRRGFDARSPLRPWAPSPETWDSRLIEAQWQRLVALGAFDHGLHAGLDSWLKRTIPTDVAAPHFLNPRQQRRAVRLLGGWLRRVKAARAAPTRSPGVGAAADEPPS